MCLLCGCVLSVLCVWLVVCLAVCNMCLCVDVCLCVECVDVCLCVDCV